MGPPGRGAVVGAGRWWLGGLVLASVCLDISRSELVDYSSWRSGGCSFSQYFDTTSMSCKSCTEGCSDDGTNCNKEADYDHVDPYGNALSCRCETGFYKVVEWNSVDDEDRDWVEGTVEAFTCAQAYTYSDDDPLSTYRTSFSDGSGAAVCQNLTFFPETGTNGVDSSGECVCPDDADGNRKVLVEADAAGTMVSKQCLSCPAMSAVVQTSGTYAGVAYKASPYACQYCPDPNMDMASSCSTCDTASGYAASPFGVSEIGPQTCVYSTHADFMEDNYDATGDALKVTYRQVQSSSDQASDGKYELDESYVFKHYFMNASTGCYFFQGGRGLEHCQALANLCALQLFDPGSKACELFNDIQSQRLTNDDVQEENWVSSLPWLYYSKTGNGVRTDRGISMSLAFGHTGGGSTTKLTFYLSSFALNGTWLGFEKLDTQLFYCGRKSPHSGLGGGTSSSSAWMKYGASMTDEFECDLETLVSEEPVFYELWLHDTAADKMFPVPVLIKDYHDSTGSSQAEANKNHELLDEKNDVFVHRFFLHDSYSGLANGFTDYPVVLRYARSIKFLIKARLDNPDKIFPPILEIGYRERKPKLGQWPGDMKTDSINFEVEYAMDGDRLRRDLTLGFFGSACGLAGLIWFRRNENWRNRNGRVPSQRRSGRRAGPGGQDIHGQEATIPEASYEWPWYFWCSLVQLVHCLNLMLFPFLFLYATSWFVFFKMQDTAYLLLPPKNEKYGNESEYFLVVVVINLLFWSQSVYLMHIIYLQCKADVFFVDMENKKTNSSSTQKVSVWRRIFVANEWAELQTQRRTSMSFTLVFLCFVMVGCDLQYLSTPQPDIYNLEPGDANLLLSFANTSWWFVVLEFCQLMWNFIATYWPFCIEPKGQLFADLCSVAKIAVIALDEKYHGYIVHRDGPPHADTSMEELTEHLLVERSNPSSGRGLFSDRGPQFEDVGCGEIFLTDGWVRWYHGIRSYLEAEANRGDVDAEWNSRPGRGTAWRRGSGGYFGPRQAGLSSLCFGDQQELEDRVRKLKVNSMEVINKGLRMFVQREFKDELHWDFAEAKNIVDEIMHAPPLEISFHSPVNIFIPDTRNRFTELHFYGIEFDLWLHMVTTFAMCQIWFDNILASAFFTFMLHKLLALGRNMYGSRRLANTSLVDETFFI